MSDPMVGRRLGAYEVVSRVGRGGMGSVYQIRHPERGRFAAKVFFRASPHCEERFRREASLVSQLDHPRLVRGYELGEEPDFLYYVMEYVEGRTLRSEIHADGRSWEDTWRLVEPVLEGLAFAHGRGIVHRDLKPANLMIAPGGEVKIVDFGLAAELALPTAYATPGYVAPEQLRGQPADPRSDQYAAGLLLFELLTGSPPFSAPDSASLVTMHALTPPPLLRSRRPDLPPTLEAIVARTLEKEPARRYPDVSALRAALAEVRSDAECRRQSGLRTQGVEEETADLRHLVQ